MRRDSMGSHPVRQAGSDGAGETVINGSYGVYYYWSYGPSDIGTSLILGHVYSLQAFVLSQPCNNSATELTANS